MKARKGRPGDTAKAAKDFASGKVPRLFHVLVVAKLLSEKRSAGGQTFDEATARYSLAIKLSVSCSMSASSEYSS